MSSSQTQVFLILLDLVNFVNIFDVVFVGHVHSYKLVSFFGRLMMRSPSGQGYKSSKNYRRWLIGTFDVHETAEDEL
jgi:hypothetical protein